MVKALLTILMGSGAWFVWLTVETETLPVPVRMWALIVFVFQLVSLVSVWRKP